METKFPLAMKNESHKTTVTAGGVDFGGNMVPILRAQIW